VLRPVLERRLDARLGGQGSAALDQHRVPALLSAAQQRQADLEFRFAPLRLESVADGASFANGIWLEGRLHLQTRGPEGAAALGRQLGPWLMSGAGSGGRLRLEADGRSWLVFAQRIRTGTPFASAYEVCAFPLGEMLERQRVLGWRVIGAGAGVMLLGLGLSYVLSYRLSAPVDRIAHDSAEQRARRAQAEAALETTSAELGRAARFSANASHQLKTPVAVLRAGLEMLQSRGTLGEHEAHEVAMLIHQTYRITSVIEDLLLLARLDAGQLRLNFTVVNLSELIAAVLDDLSAVQAHELTVEQDFPPDLPITGEKRYTALILQNLLENARKYNRPGGRIRVTARTAGDTVHVVIGNTAVRPIPVELRDHLFERFHRGGHGETIPGHGLGLSLARELARLHGGDLRLERSDAEWTEFGVSFRAAVKSEDAT
ncbi:MAG TPA: HAMP domain-containing sensor histidine kinase, partial [Lacunisphaera sp.]|nr:HAMP domain-containing sensor histidine kinase [Lacunisphaera sp.]